MTTAGMDLYRQALAEARARNLPTAYRTDLIRHDRRALLSLDPEIDRVGWVLYGEGTHLCYSRPGQPARSELAETLLDFLRYGGGACFVAERGRPWREVSRAEFIDFMGRRDESECAA